MILDWNDTVAKAPMPKLPARYSHFLFGAVQSALTCAVATGIAIAPQWQEVPLFTYWLKSWLVAWFVILPIVLVAAPGIRRVTTLLTEVQPLGNSHDR
jgi:hypothetical protein